MSQVTKFYLLTAVFFFLMLIIFSIQYHRKAYISYTMALIIGLISLWVFLHYVEGIFDFYCVILLIIGAVYGIFSQKQTKVKDSKHQAFSLRSNRGTIYFGNPRDNFLVYAGANAGKTKSIGKPLLAQYISNHWAGFIMDYKDFDYSKTAYNLCKKHNYPHQFFHINFTDLSTSSRCNIIKPAILKSETLLIQMVTDLLNAYMGEGKKDEWFMGGLGVLKGVAYRFYRHYPQYCTIPHIISFIMHNDRQRLEDFLRGSVESKALASGFIDSSDSERTQASILSSLTNYIGDLAFSKEIAYVLSGDDFDFNLIDPQAPKLLSVANSYAIDSIISPVISLMVTISSRAFSLANQVPCVYYLDEATTAKIREFEKMPSVLREYLCSFVLLTQSGAKLEKLYGRLDRSSIESNFGNLFLGRTYDSEALKQYGMFFSRKEEERRTNTRGYTNTNTSRSVSVSKTKEQRYDPDFFMGLKAGEFVGRASHSNYREFHMQFEMYNSEPEEDLPLLRMVLPRDLEQNFHQIIDVVRSIEC